MQLFTIILAHRVGECYILAWRFSQILFDAPFNHN
jgi:hypothetical protein